MYPWYIDISRLFLFSVTGDLMLARKRQSLSAEKSLSIDELLDKVECYIYYILIW